MLLVARFLLLALAVESSLYFGLDLLPQRCNEFDVDIGLQQSSGDFFESRIEDLCVPFRPRILNRSRFITFSSITGALLSEERAELSFRPRSAKTIVRVLGEQSQDEDDRNFLMRRALVSLCRLGVCPFLHDHHSFSFQYAPERSKP
jgi:hypothetical protein